MLNRVLKPGKIMDVLSYNELEPRKAKEQFERVVGMLRSGDFASAEVKKLTPTAYFRAKLNAADRLLFSIMKYQGRKVILLLEIIYNHDYAKSRFLQGAAIDEDKIAVIRNPGDIAETEVAPMVYRNPDIPFFHYLDRCLSFDETQYQLLNAKLPMIIVGSAGSGKTVLSLEKLKNLSGDILYVTRSAYLADNSRRLYYSDSYDNARQNIDFLSFDEVLGNLKVPDGKEVGFREFAAWLRQNRPGGNRMDAHQLFEEFSGVITGGVSSASLSAEEYQALGVKQSIFPAEERGQVYELFRRFSVWMKENGHYLGNMLCHRYLSLANPSYDGLVVDEVQDLTAVQLFLLLKLLRNPFNFLLCGDSNQIVHPNFFSWSAVKTLFYKEKVADRSAEIRILQANYRNSLNITTLANWLLRWKVARFGSVDRESNYLVQCTSALAGGVTLLPDDPRIGNELNQKTAESVQFAVLVLRDEDKDSARRIFKTPLVFSVREAKGLEYRNIILYNFLSPYSHEFEDIAADLMPDDLAGELRYARNCDKSDRSLEIYKFYINSLYVAITRAVENLYWLERRTDHKAFRLLNLTPAAGNMNLSSAKSTMEEWRKEAGKLEAQGKNEQAETIRRTVLKHEPVPWPVLTREKLPELLKIALDWKNFNGKAKRQLLNYATANDYRLFYGRLTDSGFAHALRNGEHERNYKSTYCVPFNPYNRKKLMRDLQRYGTDFRDEFNRTPLMMACLLGEAPLAWELLDMDANIELTDNLGRKPFDCLCKYLYGREGDLGEFKDVYKRLEPSHILVRTGGRQLKIGSNTMEFFILSLMLAAMPEIIRNKEDNLYGYFSAATSGDILEVTAKLPDFIMPEYRKKRQYTSSILSKNELDGTSPYNRKLFIRLRNGHYLPNPDLELLHDGKWIRWNELIGFRYFDDYNRTFLFPVLQIYLKEKTISQEHMLFCWRVLAELREPLDHSPYAFDPLMEAKNDPYVEKFGEELASLTDDLPPLPPSMDELLKIRGKNCTDRLPLFLSRAELKELIKDAVKKADSMGKQKKVKPVVRKVKQSMPDITAKEPSSPKNASLLEESQKLKKFLEQLELPF